MKCFKRKHGNVTGHLIQNIVKTSKAKFSTFPSFIVIVDIIMRGVDLEQNGESNTDDGMVD